MNHFFQSMTNLTVRPPRPDSIIHEQQKLAWVPDAHLADRASELRDRFLDGDQESSLAAETFSLVREAARRQLGIEHRTNQLDAAWHLLQRHVVELPTGEGKTLAATLALALRAFTGRGVWLATANDYLARRDAQTMQGVLERLGLTVGYVQTHHSPDERRQAYQCDVTYGTIREFGFDFLRDRMSLRRNRSSREQTKLLQRERFSIVVDEADAILLDDARTPLIISEPRASSLDDVLFQWSTLVGRHLTVEVDYLIDPASTKIWLTDSGRARIRREASSDVLTRVTLPEAYEAVVRAIEAETAFQLNRDYVIRDGKIVIVDRLTGRLAEGRQWQNGIQQSLEAVNQLEITDQTNPVAKVTIQAFLRGFEHLSGMTGTAREAAAEFRDCYGMRSVVIPPFRPCRRIEWPVQIEKTRQEKWNAVTAAVREVKSHRRPVLIGTRDLNASEELSDHLRSANIEHQVLTAKQEADEAELISRAGEEGTVTVSTSIAGRGTDIRLGPGVAESGGLHVIAADLFDASRIDRQLAGRAGRQGDPASYQRILSLEDDLLSAAWDFDTCQRRIKRVISSGPPERLALLQSAQKQLERQHTLSRRDLLNRDRERSKRNQELGFDPYLDDAES